VDVDDMAIQGIFSIAMKKFRRNYNALCFIILAQGAGLKAQG
jgi:hypothetical protein